VGAAVEVLEAGPPDGPLLLLLHGFPQTPSCWQRLLPALAAAGYRSVAPTQRGYGLSPRPQAVAEYGIETLVKDVLALADRLGAPTFSVVGHDWGGAIAWRLAADHPERLVSCTSLATPHPAALAQAALRSTQALRSLYVPFFRLPVLPERALLAGRGAVFREILVTSGLDQKSAKVYVEAMRQPGALSAALNWYRAASPTGLARTGPSRVPTLFVWGSRDLALGRAAASASGRHVDAPYRFEALEGASHWLPEQHSAAVAEVLVPHLLEHGPH